MEKYFEFMQKNGKPIPENCLLAIVCNTKSNTIAQTNCGNFSMNTEYLSDDELQQITQMALAQQITFRIFTDENSFISYLVNPKTDKDRVIVYNSAQSGTGAGRKSLIPSICRYYHIRHTGSDPYRVSLCRDKFAVFSILSQLGIAVPKSYLFNQGELNGKLERNTKYIAKPIYESSSIGILQENIFYGANFPIHYINKLEKTLQQPLIIQEFISGYELEIPILAGKHSHYVFSPVILHQTENNLIMGDEILDYNKIYDDNYLFASLPSHISDESIKQTALKVAKELCLSGLCRVDFRLRNDNSFYVTDVSTNPHFVKHSSVNYAFKRINLSDKQLFRTILELS